MFLRADSSAEKRADVPAPSRGAEAGSPQSSPSPTLRGLALDWSGAVFTAALGEALLVAAHGPLDANVWSLRALLLLVPLLLVAVALIATWPLRGLLAATRSHVQIGGVITLTLLFLGWSVALWATEWESSVALRSARGLALLGLFGGAATVVAVGAGLLSSRSGRVRRLGPAPVAAASAALLAVACFHVGRNVELAPFWPLRMLNLVLEAALMLVAAVLLRRTGVVGRGASLAGGFVVAGAALVALKMPPKAAHTAYARIMLDAGSERRVLLGLRQLLDRDGDGFSLWLDGGGCDEHNPDARPLGPIDCAGLLHRGEPPSATPSFAGVPAVSRVLLLTVDAWRCELRGSPLCARLSALAPTASYAGEQRPFMAQTTRSLGALFGQPYDLSPDEAATSTAPTIAAARAAGWSTKAIYTVRMFSGASMGGSFEERDESLIKGPIGESINSGALTARLLADLADHRDSAGKRLVWAHYMDPHATYVPTAEGEPVPFFLFDRRGAYAAEVRRVEGHLADAVAAAQRLGYDRDAAIVVTSDHGESFSHGRIYHSTSSYEPEMKIPLFAWVFDRDGRLVKLDLPPRTDERAVAALLSHLLGVPAPRGQSAVSVTDPKDGDVQYLVVDDGWKLIYHHQAHYEELYDLASDPREDHDLSSSAPEQLERLRRRLGAELSVIFPDQEQASAQR